MKKLVHLVFFLKDGRILSGVYWPEGARLRLEFARTLPLYAEHKMEDVKVNNHG